MERVDATASLSGLAHETRLDVFRLLVEAGHAGMPAGKIGDRLGLAPATLSFHLNHLKHAGLVDCRRDGRSLIYSADFVRMSTLIAYLTENCCEGNPEACGLPDCKPAAGMTNSKSRTATRRDGSPRARLR